MPTTKPRISITLDPDQHEVLARLADLQGRPMSRIVMELLGEMTPVLGRLCVVMEAAVQARVSVKTAFQFAADHAEEKLMPHAEMVLRRYEEMDEDLRLLIDDQPPSRSRVAEGADVERSAAAPSLRPGLVPLQQVERQASASSGKDPQPVITGVRTPQQTEGKPSKRAGRRSRKQAA
jgi:hypothetical protein